LSTLTQSAFLFLKFSCQIESIFNNFSFLIFLYLHPNNKDVKQSVCLFMRKIIILSFLFIAFSAFSQKDSLSHNLPKHNITIDNILCDSADSIFQKHHILASMISLKNKQKIIQGQRVNDTLYIYIKKRRKTDTIINIIDSIESRLKLINLELFEAGYFFNLIKPKKIILIKNKVHIFYDVENLDERQLNYLVFVSKKKLPDNIKKYLHKQYLNQTISSAKIKDVEGFINSHTNFQIARPTEFLFQKKMTKAYIYLNPKKSNSFDGNLGFLYNPSIKKIELLGNLNLHANNLFGANENIQLKWQKIKTNQSFFLSSQFPFIRGSTSFINSEIFLNRKDTSNLYVSTKIGYGFMKKNNSFEIGYQYSKDVSATFDKNLSLISFGHKYIFLKNDNDLSRFGLAKFIQTEIAYQTGANNRNYIFYNHFKYFKHIWNGFSSSIDLSAFYSNSTNKYVQTKNSFFRNYNYILNEMQQALSAKTQIIYHKSQYLFYSIHDFELIYLQDNKPSATINLGFGADLLNRNQILTLEFYKPIIIQQCVDNQSFIINIKTQILF